MAYAKQTWANGEAGATPLSAARLNHLEDGVAAVDAALTGKQDAGDYVTSAQLASGLAGKSDLELVDSFDDITAPGPIGTVYVRVI